MKHYLPLTLKTRHMVWWLAAWTSIVVSSLLVRNFLPIDETRYVSVAWEMWVRQDFLLPTLNMEPYSHKPPLMFWLFQLGWAIFGVNSWWPRIVPALFALACVFLTSKLALRLWPNTKELSWQAPTILTGTFFWTLFTPTTMFDMILTFFAVLGIYGLVLASQKCAQGWWLFALAVGLGILTKGPVALLPFAFPALLAPFWVQNNTDFSYKKWIAQLSLFLCLGIIISLLWAIPAAIKGGAAYTNEIFLSQTVNRVQQSFAHQHPWYWYLPLLPILMMPWLFLLNFWKNLISLSKNDLDSGLRLILIWLVPTFLCFCFISAKQIHYLLPLFPAFALLTARILKDQSTFNRLNQAIIALVIIFISFCFMWAPVLLTSWHKAPFWISNVKPFWGIIGIFFGIILLCFNTLKKETALFLLSFTCVFIVLGILFGIMRPAKVAYNLKPVSKTIAKIQRQGKLIVHVGGYHNQYQFIGRLKQGLPIVKDCLKREWASNHPDGYLIDYINPTTPLLQKPTFSQPYRGKIVLIWQSQQFLKLGDEYPFSTCPHLPA